MKKRIRKRRGLSHTETHKRPESVPLVDWEGMAEMHKSEIAKKYNLWFESILFEDDFLTDTPGSRDFRISKGLLKSEKVEDKDIEDIYAAKTKVYFSQEGLRKTILALSPLKLYKKPNTIEESDWNDECMKYAMMVFKRPKISYYLAFEDRIVSDINKKYNVKLQRLFPRVTFKFEETRRGAHEYNWDNDIPNSEW